MCKLKEKPVKKYITRFQSTLTKEELSKLRIKKEQLLQAASTPLISPAYPAGPYRFFDREYMIIAYVTLLFHLYFGMKSSIEITLKGN